MEICEKNDLRVISYKEYMSRCKYGDCSANREKYGYIVNYGELKSKNGFCTKQSLMRFNDLRPHLVL